MIKRMILMLLLAGLVLGGIYGYKTFGHMMMLKYMAAQSNPPQTVSTVKAGNADWQDKIKAIGTFKPVLGTSIASEASGLVRKIYFQSGQDVEKGAILLEINSDTDVAHLRSLEAAEKLAEITYDRDEKQLKAQTISQATFDADAATLSSARAAVAEEKATIDKKIVRAPFSGQLGIKQVDEGQYLNAGTAIVTLQQVDPVYLDFYVPQKSVALLKVGQKVQAHLDAAPDKVFEGEISAIDAQVEEATRNILVRATFPNKDRSLIPGMFASTEIVIGEPKAFVTLPQTAITYNPYGSTVFVVEQAQETNGKAQLSAKQVFVTTGDTRGDQVAVLTGVKEGDIVVTSGQIKLKNGTPVIENNKVEPLNDQDPKPQDY